MTAQRAAQWNERLGRLRSIEADLMQALRYDRAKDVKLAAKRAYDRWAIEVLRGPARPGTAASS